jgi:AAA domain/Protein of unknown function (DUF4011)
MILRTMLQRLYASMMSGPGLNARPHTSRQRVDFADLRHLNGSDPAKVLHELLEQAGRAGEFPARVPKFEEPEEEESKWTEDQRRARDAFTKQGRILSKLRDIAADAVDHYNDYGEHALFLGFPLLSIPPSGTPGAAGESRVLAPVVLVPVNLRVSRGVGAGVTLELAGHGADKVQPNPSLLAWIEQRTGKSAENLFADESGEDPWREIAEMVALAATAAGLPPNTAFTRETRIQPAPRTEELPPKPALLPCAVLGLLPIANRGLLRDTRWMLENEPALNNPVRPFLAPEALAMPDPGVEHRPAADAHTDAAPDAASEWLVTHADPCQAAAVAHARTSAALVIHGPPGTGKSQTIANIIGDHLARGERVLFVCDKRTALDVVKYRLDAMGLGPLCGIIHDPQADRRDFYLGLRERLENLARDPAPVGAEARLKAANDRLRALRAELRASFDDLHQMGENRAFHDLCGEWLPLRAAGVPELDPAPGLTPAMVAAARADTGEILRRAVRARWPENPFRGRLGMRVEEWLATTPSAVRASLDATVAAASAVDAIPGDELPPLDPSTPLADQAVARRDLASRLDTAAQRGWIELAARAAAGVKLAAFEIELKGLCAESALLSKPVERELLLMVKGALPSRAACKTSVSALVAWGALTNGFTRFFAFGRKKEARLALAPLALPLTGDGPARARTFFEAIRARHLVSDLRDRTLGIESAAPPSDEILSAFCEGLPEISRLAADAEAPANALVRDGLLATLRSLPAAASGFAGALRRSADRADAAARWESTLTATRLFSGEALGALAAEVRRGRPVAPVSRSFAEASDTLDEAIRLTDRHATLPAPLQAPVADAAMRGLEGDPGADALRALALSGEIKDRLRQSPSLARIDTERVEAAFKELAAVTAEKLALVRSQIIHRWGAVWRDRLLASTGGRLNALGAALRQRLFVRGQRALKLRQMISAGAESDGGDPLFDLCPVWMAAPATVAQIFPRTALFDAVIFDEASQCRLEEALPVLLRARRVVIAGDPRQLPPTRFFEHAFAKSDDFGAETAEEVFEQQQSEAEDLLTAALNLNVQEAFLDVHYRSRDEALIGFSNQAFYGSRLQPIPGHPRNKAFESAIRIYRVDGVYRDRGNEGEAAAVVDLVAALLDDKTPPSIGVACFNLNQRDLILDALDTRAEKDPAFAARLQTARHRRGADSFEGLFVKNLENVQGDERDHIIISTTFGPDAQGRFRRNFGALSRGGGERRLNVLVTRARAKVHILTSIPRAEYAVAEPPQDGRSTNGRRELYAYLRYAEHLHDAFEEWQKRIEGARGAAKPDCNRGETTNPSAVAERLGETLRDAHGIGSTVYWGNDGFCIDVALTHPRLPFDVTLGVLADFTRYRKTPDPVAWEQFRAAILKAQGWDLHRLWTPALFRDLEAQLTALRARHETAAMGPAAPSAKVP